MAQTPEQDTERLMEHSYDGIREFDNPLPRWWVYLFYATIVFSVLYWFNLGVGIGPGRLAQYEADVAAARAAHPPPAESGPGELAALASNPAVVSAGRTVFTTNCASCHKADGGGLIGPNLTDDAWIHGGSLPEIHRIVSEGVLAKGMPNWGKLLRPDDLDAVVAYVASIRNSNVAGGKAAEGTKVAP
jgi:cytochrome c oxidase cbb3-type subunit 3